MLKYLRYIESSIPCICILDSLSLTWFSTSASTMLSGISATSFSARASSTFSASSLSAASLCLFSIFDARSARYSANVLNSDTSTAKSSSAAGSSVFSIALSFTLKTAALPASSLAPYSVGKVTFTSNSSPMFLPTMPSSKPGMN